MYLIVVLNTMVYIKTARWIEKALQPQSVAYHRMKKLFEEFKFIPIVLAVCWVPTITLYVFIMSSDSLKSNATFEAITNYSGRIGPSLTGTADAIVVLILQKRVRDMAFRIIKEIKSCFCFAFFKDHKIKGVNLQEDLLKSEASSYVKAYDEL